MSADIEATNIRPAAVDEKNAAAIAEKGTVEHVNNIKEAAHMKGDAIEAEAAEFNMTVWEAAKAYPMACFWACVVSSTIIVSPYTPALCKGK